MPSAPSPAARLRDPALWLAVALCVALAGGRSLSGWDDLAALRLPDTDDVMRLVQIRDWLGGQAFHDLTQYRLGPPGGTPMHWSRIGDIGPAAIILLATPIFGAQGGEIAALILWPSLLLLAFMLLCAALTGRLAGDAARPIAVVLAAFAWPATGLFVPGRLDHHGLQLVLLLGATMAMLAPAGRRSGAIAGGLIAASLAVGLEALFPIVLLCAFAIGRWLWNGADEAPRLRGLSFGLAGSVGIASLLAPTNWTYPGCDAFTQQAALASLAGAVTIGAFSCIPAAPSVTGRILGTGIGATVALVVVAGFAPACISDPYAAIDPFVRANWLSKVEEARGLLQLSAVDFVSNAGLPLLALAAAGRQWERHRDSRWTLIVLLIAGSIALALHQARAVHLAAALAPAALAPIVAQIRTARRKIAPLAWLASIGISYPLAAQALLASPAGPARCDSQSAIAALAALPPVTIIAPIDLGPRLLAQTPHHVVAAPYHRNQWGIAAALRAARDPANAGSSGANYLIACDAAPDARLLRIAPAKER